MQEEQLLREIRGLQQGDIKKIVKMIHFMKREIFEAGRGEKPALDIMHYAGMLKDLSFEEAELFANAIQRRPLFGTRGIAL